MRWLGLVLLVGVGCGTSVTTGSSSPEVTVDLLEYEYNTNAKAMQAKYEDKKFRIVGFVVNITPDSSSDNNKTYWWVRLANQMNGSGFVAVECHELAGIQQIHVGDMVSCDGKIFSVCIGHPSPVGVSKATFTVLHKAK